VNAVVHSVLAAGEPSKVPFYIMGGILASWAVVLAAIGLSNADFPGSPGRARAVMAISAVLVLGTVSSAVATSAKRHEESGAEPANPHGQEPAPPGVDTTRTPPPGGAPASELKVSADPTGQLKFEQSSLTAKAGEVTVVFDNPAPVDHDVTIEQDGHKLGGTKAVSQGKANAVIDLKPGDYTFYCSIDGHRQAGMEGKLTVK
jgi:plastocyanin